jgi:hypothetical protein
MKSVKSEKLKLKTLYSTFFYNKFCLYENELEIRVKLKFIFSI